MKPTARVCGLVRVASLAAMAVWLAACGGTEATVVVGDAKRIGPGDRVIQNGVPIGTVRSVASRPDGRVAVRIVIEAAHLESTRAESTALIEASRTEFGAVELTLYPLAREGPPIQPGTVIEGVDGPIALKLRRARSGMGQLADDLGPALEDALAGLRGWVDEVEVFLKSEEAEQIGAEARRFMEDAQELVREAGELSQREIKRLEEEFPELRRELEQHLERARTEGNRALEGLLEELRRQIREMEEQLEE